LKLNVTILSLCLLFFSSCYDVKKPEKPDRFLDEDEMTNILVDLAIVSAAKGIDKRKLEDLNILPKAYVFKKHNIDSVILAQNNTYYAYQLDVYNAIYKRVNDSLNVLKKLAQDKSLKKLDLSSEAKKANLKGLRDTIPKKPKAFGSN
jgi:hypothetical protein